ncbi:hypothetical protein H0Z60_16735 [Ectothiorhodospiraceae bacterium WFHF3C12]|nr:hypothetical protein [Ectothiorhodospiraceae bacterium WFHF3C12]
MSDSQASPWRGRAIMIIVVLLFAVPPVVAWMMLTGGWRPGGTVNHGELIRPPEQLSGESWLSQLPEDYFAGRWTLLHAVAGDCDDGCTALLDKSGRVRVALDKDAARVQRLLLLAEGAAPVAESGVRGARVVRADRATIRGLLPAGERHGLSVVDPQGFRMMRYGMPLQAKGLLEDLERLLRLSNEDIERFQRSEAIDDS